jgi:hypothetical protein
MELYLDKRAVKQIRMSAADAIEEGDTDTLREDILDAFPEEQVETVEQLLGGTDLYDLLGDIIDEWSGDDVDELFELMESQLSDHGIDLKYSSRHDDEDEDEDEDEEEADDEEEEDLEDEEDDGFSDLDEYDEPGFDEDL